MRCRLTHAAALISVAIPLLLSACGVPQSDYDALKTQNQQLTAQLAAANAQVARLQGAIKYTVNSDLLFPSGGWQMSDRGKEVIARLARKLAPTQANHLLVNGYTDNVPIGPALMQQGITSNQVLSQKRAENVVQFLISQGVNANLVSAHGYGQSDPVASNATAEGRAKNRRVVLELAPANS